MSIQLTKDQIVVRQVLVYKKKDKVFLNELKYSLFSVIFCIN